MATVVVFLTSGTTWSVPSGVTSVQAECIGGGGGGSAAGGGGGAYAKKNTITVTPSGSVTYQIGSGGTFNASGTDTWFSTSGTVFAAHGSVETMTVSGGIGGLAANCIGDLIFAGGNGGNRTNISEGGSGGGGAGGPNGIGKNGGNAGGVAGSGGGGCNGGTAGAASTTTAGSGGNNFSGIGGGAASTAGTAGGGGGGTTGTGTGGAGGLGTLYDSSHGPGGGGGGGSFTSGTHGGNGGLYGGGGAGCVGSSAQGVGAAGLIVLTYTAPTTFMQSVTATTNITASTQKGITKAVPTTTTNVSGTLAKAFVRNITAPVNVFGYQNQISNVSFAGAVSGSPGTDPNGMSHFVNDGLAYSVNGTGIEANRAYLEVRFFGTTTGSSNSAFVFTGSSFIPAAAAQFWIATAYIKLQAGTMNNIQFNAVFLGLNEYDSGFNSVNSQFFGFGPTSTIAFMDPGKITLDPNTAFITLGVYFNFAGSVAIDTTLRFYTPILGLPNLGKVVSTNKTATTSGLSSLAKALAVTKSATANVNTSIKRSVAVAKSATTNVTSSIKKSALKALSTNTLIFNAANSVTNPTFSGAVTGTPGTDPTNMSHFINNGLTYQTVGTGIENGLNYLEIRFSGTTTNSQNAGIVFTNTPIATIFKASFYSSIFAKLTAGSFANISSASLGVVEEGATFNFLNGFFFNFIATTTIQQVIGSGTFTDAGTLFSTLGFYFNPASSVVAIDFTIRLYQPIFVLNRFSLRVNKNVAATTNTTTTILHKIVKALSATTNVTASLFPGKAFLKTLTATTNVVATKAIQVNKTLSATTNVTASLTKALHKSMTATTNVTTSLSKLLGKSIAATINVVASMSHATPKALSATTNVQTSIVKRVSALKAATTAINTSLQKLNKKSLQATANVVTTLARIEIKTLNATVNVGSSLSHVLRKAMQATTSVIASQVKAVRKGISAIMGVGASLTSQTGSKSVTLTATVNVSTPSIARSMFRSLMAVIRTIASLVATQKYDPGLDILIIDDALEQSTIIDDNLEL